MADYTIPGEVMDQGSILPTATQDFWGQFPTAGSAGNYTPLGGPVGPGTLLPNQGGGQSGINGNNPQTLAGQPPSYVNLSDPVQAAVWQAFQQKGITPRDQGDFNYWVDQINKSGGLATGYQNAGGTGTWAERMARASGGVGDYGGGGGGGGMGGVMPGAGYLGQIYGGQYQVPSEADAMNMPGLQFMLGEGQKAIERSAAAKGTLLTGGTLKGLSNWTTQNALSQGYLPLANLGLNAFNTNYNVFRNNQNDLFNRYYSLSDLGYRASA